MERTEIAPYLRHLAALKTVGGHKLKPVLIQAADEIERLRAALDEALSIAVGSGADFNWQTLERLRELKAIDQQSTLTEK